MNNTNIVDISKMHKGQRYLFLHLCTFETPNFLYFYCKNIKTILLFIIVYGLLSFRIGTIN